MRWKHTRLLILVMVFFSSFLGSELSYARELPAPIIFTEEECYPQDVENALTDDILYQQGAKLVQVNNKAYVILSLGLRRSTGYNIEITKATLKNGQLIIWATEHAPSGDFVGWVFTNPRKIISVPDEGLEVKHLTVIYN